MHIFILLFHPQFLMKLSLESRSSHNRSGLSAAYKRTLDFYGSCMDEGGSVEGRGGSPMLGLLERVGGWRIMDNSNSNSTVLDKDRYGWIL